MTTPAASSSSSSVGVSLSTGAGDGMMDPLLMLDERHIAKAQLEAAEEQLKGLCAVHAGTFVAVERRAASVSAALSELSQRIQAVEPDVGAVQEALEHDGNSLSQLSDKHRVRRRTLLQHSSLLELLELPSLMDACVRSNLYEEALSIASFANTLERRHAEKQQNLVVGRVIGQIRSRQADLRRHLLLRLKQAVTMPQCLEIVTALRRLNSIDLEQEGNSNNTASGASTNAGNALGAAQQRRDEEERLHQAMEFKLQVDFLEARDAWLDSSPNTAAAATKTTRGGSTTAMAPSEQLLDTIERYRTRVFEIATQFNAIFRATSVAGSRKSGPVSKSASLLSMWTTRRVHSFLTMLSSSSLQRMQDAASLRDALEACVFFATSMGRLGGDFTALLPPLFEPKMMSLVVSHWKDGASTLQETLKVCRDAGVASPLTAAPSVSMVTAAGTAQGGGAAAGTSREQPPRQLLTTPPLARLVNAYLNGLNELRRCLLPGIFPRLRKELQESLRGVREVLETNQRAVKTPGLRGEATQLREVAAQLIAVFDNLVQPYLTGALEVAIGDYVTAAELLKKEVLEPEEEKEEDEEEEDEEKEDEEEEVQEEGEEGESEEKEEEVAEDDAEVPQEQEAAAEDVMKALEIEEETAEPDEPEPEPTPAQAGSTTADGWDDF